MKKMDKLRKKYHREYEKGYNSGYDRGYDSGCATGTLKYHEPFAGTSIIIPTYNQKQFLEQCIQSIRAYTSEAHEIIVIDNGSTDGTNRYLKSLHGHIRYKIFSENLGFAGGINQGLLMARGDTILLLNNDTVVTSGWLTNLLTCLNSNEKFGLVGPVTNYISGEQLIETSYRSMEGMHRFAAANNHSDPSRWKTTGRLTGFCVLMRRHLFNKLGYLDEGFEIGNCEDDDYGFRTRLLGYELVIAADSFIHHVGSVSIKSLGSTKFNEVYGKNLEFYSRKWGDSHSLLIEIQRMANGNRFMMNDFYPSHMIVQAVGTTKYWVENGVRYALEFPGEMPAARISQIDLRNWPLAGNIALDALYRKIAEVNSGLPREGPIPDGILLKTPDGAIYQHKQGTLHRIINDWAISLWMLNQRLIFTITEERKNMYPLGLPIIAPILIKANNM